VCVLCDVAVLYGCVVCVVCCVWFACVYVLCVLCVLPMLCNVLYECVILVHVAGVRCVCVWCRHCPGNIVECCICFL